MKKLNLKGFSLVELLVVITIIAILSVVAYSAVGGQTGKARDARRQQDLAAIKSALEVYYIENGKYPADQSGVLPTDQTDPDFTPKYLEKIPKDPADKDYKYESTNTTYQIAATLENEGTAKAYVVGNGTDLIDGTGSPSCGKVKDGQSCLPYDL